MFPINENVAVISSGLSQVDKVKCMCNDLKTPNKNKRFNVGGSY